MTTEPTTPAPASEDIDQEAEAKKAWDEFAAARKDGTDPAPAAAAETGKEPAQDPAAAPAADTVKDPDPAPAASPKTDGAAPEGDAPKNDDDPDLWADAKPELRTAYEAARGQLDNLKAAKTRAEGAMSGLQRKVNDLSRQVDALKTAPKADPTAAIATPNGKDPDPAATNAGTKPVPEKIAAKMAAIKEEYPELGAMLEDVVSEITANTKSDVDAVKTELSGLTTRQQERYLEAQVEVVAEKHADFTEALKSPEFHAWYETAPAYKRAAVDRNGEHFVDGPEVASLIDDFKLETGWKAEAAPAPSAPTNGTGKPTNPAPSRKREAQLRSATAPRTGSPAGAAAGIPEDPEGAWKAFEKMGL
jgi:hypothetical protein